MAKKDAPKAAKAAAKTDLMKSDGAKVKAPKKGAAPKAAKVEKPKGASKKADKPDSSDRSGSAPHASKPEAKTEGHGAVAPARPASKRLAAVPAETAPEKPASARDAAPAAEVQALKKALKELEGEKRRLASLAEKHEHALADEAQRRASLEKKLESGAGGALALEAKVSELRVHLEAAQSERDELKKKTAELEKNAGKPSPQLVAEVRAKAEAAAETKVRALTNEREGLRARMKELEASSQGAADRVRLEKLEEKLMELQIERDSFRERLTEAEAQLGNAPTGDVIDRIKISLADAERDRDRYREKVIDLEAQVAAVRGGFSPSMASGSRVNVIELQSRLEEAEREREKAERERDELEKRVHALKTDLYTRKKTPDSGDKHFCPGCGTEMRGVVNSSVNMTVCPQCSGLYLSRGEVAAIVAQEREVMKQAAKGSFFSRIFGAKSS